MDASSRDLDAIPVYRLALRRLRLGPFGSGMDLLKFLGLAVVGAVVAAATNAVLWLPFLAAGTALATVRVEGQSLDDFAVGYCRFRWRSSHPSPRASGASPPDAGRGGLRTRPAGWVRAGGIPIAYLPAPELHRLFDEWRSALGSFDHPIGCRVGGERLSALPFLPTRARPHAAEQGAIASYREMVQLLLRHRYRRVVDLTVWDVPRDGVAGPAAREGHLDDLVGALARMGIPAHRMPSEEGAPVASTEVIP